MLKDYNRPDYSSGKKPKRNRRRESLRKEERGLNRRTFLKASVALAAAWGVGKFVFDSDKEESPKQEKEKQDSPEQPVATEQQLEIEKDDQDIIGSTIEEQLRKGEKVTLNIETKRAIRQKWKQSYSKRPDDCPREDRLTGKNHLGLLQSMEKMQPWVEHMKAEFKVVGVPEKYAYLAIPESHFDLNANSRANAKGPYQFTSGTAKLFKLHVGGGIDQRCDPIESARACAEHLKYSYERFNNDWELAFADYNGGFTGAYAKFRPKKSERNYEDYLAWREGRINKFIQRDHFEHKVRKSDRNLTKISRMYGVEIAEIIKANGMKDDGIKVGQKLKIPATTSVKMFKLRDSLENLNYPEKFYAVLDVIEEESLETRFPALAASFVEGEVPKVSMQEFSYKVKRGDGLWVVARVIRARLALVDPETIPSIPQIQAQLQKQNKLASPRDIKPGQELKVKLPTEKGASLRSLAEDRTLSLTKLRELNPSILSSKQILPAGLRIRFPK